MAILGMISASNSFAGNRLNCTWSSSSNGCFFKNMKLYNQRLVSDMHCAPTSAAMGLSALTFAGLSYYTGSSSSASSSTWTYNKFINKSEIDRIKNFGAAMNTSSTGGTSGHNVKKFRDRERDFPGGSSNLDDAWNVSISNSHIRSLVLDSQAHILTYGHYKEKCSHIGSKKYCSYGRNGGHVIAVNGYYYDANGINITFNDPWNAVVKNRFIEKLPNYTTFSIFGITLDLRPFNSRTYYVYRSGDAVKIIDHINGIKTR